MADPSTLAAGLAFLIPLGYALIALGALPEDRARQASLGLAGALGLSILSYAAIGFGLQYGGVGLVRALAGFDGLIWEWSALGEAWGSGWGMAGLAGWGLRGPAGTPQAYTLASASLPWVLTATVIPLVALRGRIPAWAVGLVGLLTGAVLYPLGGNWIWGGGWLANLGGNLGLGHGFVDAGGAGLVHVLGAAIAAAGMAVFVGRTPPPPPPGRPDQAGPVVMPPIHLPLLAALGAGMLLAGLFAWMVSNPLLSLPADQWPLLGLNVILAAAGGALLPLLYSWFMTGRADPLMTARGLAVGAVAISAAAPFVPPWAAIAIGACSGLLVTLVIFVVDHVFRWDDPTAALTVHGLAGALGLLAVGLFADGLGGQGWNSIGAKSHLGAVGQGVTGLLAAKGFMPDWPAQMQSQIIGLAALVLLGFFGTWVFLAPPAIVGRLVRPITTPKTRFGLDSNASTGAETGPVVPVLEADGPAHLGTGLGVSYEAEISVSSSEQVDQVPPSPDL